MPIEVVLREFEDDLEVLTVAGNFPPGEPEVLWEDLSYELGNLGSIWHLLGRVATHLHDNYPGSNWSIKVERWDGYVYWLRFDGPTLASEETSRPVMSEPVVRRVSRYRRDPVV